MLGNAIEQIEELLLVAALVSMLARRVRLPYTVGLTLAGFLVTFFAHGFEIHLTRDLVFEVLLPPLIFEAAFQIDWRRFKAELPVTTTLATLGVVVSSALVATGVHLLLNWSWASSLMVAVLISATDPVAVIASFREFRVGGRIQILVEAESLLNDGTAAVFFGIVLAATEGSAVSASGVAGSFLVTVGGGVLCGGLVGGVLLLLAGRTADHLVELTFTTIAAYGSFLLAERFHLSGVLATMTAGLLLGNVGSLGAISDAGREAVESFWEYVGFVANSLIFLLIGASLAEEHLGRIWIPCLIVVALVLIARAAAVYGCSALFSRTRHRVDPRLQHVLFWGGLRGALALALALGLPKTFENRSAIIAVAFAVVAFSVVVQGLTVVPLLKRLGLLTESPERVEA